MRNKIFGTIAMLWSSALVPRLVLAADEAASSSGQDGEGGFNIPAILAFLVLCWFFFRKPK